MDKDNQHAKKNDLLITRVYDAPLEEVYKAFIDPKKIAQWWGPKDFINPVCELDVRPGGGIHIDTQAPDGTVYPMGGIFHKIVDCEELDFTIMAFEDDQRDTGLEVLIIVMFFEDNSKTTVNLNATIIKSTPLVENVIAGMEEGCNQSMDRLEDILT